MSRQGTATPSSILFHSIGYFYGFAIVAADALVDADATVVVVAATVAAVVVVAATVVVAAATVAATVAAAVATETVAAATLAAATVAVAAVTVDAATVAVAAVAVAAVAVAAVAAVAVAVVAATVVAACKLSTDCSASYAIPVITLSCKATLSTEFEVRHMCNNCLNKMRQINELNKINKQYTVHSKSCSRSYGNAVTYLGSNLFILPIGNEACLRVIIPRCFLLQVDLRNYPASTPTD